MLFGPPHTYVCEEVWRIPSDRRNPRVKVLTYLFMYLFIYFAPWQGFRVMWCEVEHLAIPTRYIPEERRSQLHGSVSLKSRHVQSRHEVPFMLNDLARILRAPSTSVVSILLARSRGTGPRHWKQALLCQFLLKLAWERLPLAFVIWFYSLYYPKFISF